MRPTTTNKQNNTGADPSHAPQQDQTHENSSPVAPGVQQLYTPCPGAEPGTDEAVRDEWLLFEAWRVGMQ